MARVNPFSLPRAKHEPKAQTFTDPLFPDSPVSLTLRFLNTPASYKALERAQELIRQYLTGDGDEMPIPFPAVDGESPEVTEKLLIDMACIEYAQCPPSEHDRYSVEDLVAFSMTMPTAYDAMVRFYAEVQKAGTQREKKPSAESTETPSPTLSAS